MRNLMINSSQLFCTGGGSGAFLRARSCIVKQINDDDADDDADDDDDCLCSSRAFNSPCYLQIDTYHQQSGGVAAGASDIAVSCAT